MQDIYYHRHRGLSTVFVKKFKIFFAKQKKVLLPPSGGGRRALFSAADSSPAPPCARGYPCALCGALCALRCPVRPGVPRAPWDALCALECPCVACGVPCALCGVLRALECPCAVCGAPVRPCGAPVRPCGAPVRPCGAPVRPCGALRASVSLAAHRAPQYRARLSPASQQLSPPPRGGPLPRPAAHGREKARPLQKERPGLVHFAVRR